MCRLCLRVEKFEWACVVFGHTLERFYVASADRDTDAIGREPAADPATIALEAVILTWSYSRA